MRLRTIAPSIIALSLIGAPVAAQAATVDRSSAPAVEENEFAGTYLWIILAIAAIVAGVLIFDDNDDPASP